MALQEDPQEGCAREVWGPEALLTRHMGQETPRRMGTGHDVRWLTYDHPQRSLHPALRQSRHQKDLLAPSNEDVRMTANTRETGTPAPHGL